MYIIQMDGSTGCKCSTCTSSRGCGPRGGANHCREEVVLGERGSNGDILSNTRYGCCKLSKPEDDVGGRIRH